MCRKEACILLSIAATPIIRVRGARIAVPGGFLQVVELMPTPYDRDSLVFC
jgi:hypothetical protein